MTYGLPDSFIVGATKRLGGAITTQRRNRKSATQPLLDEWKADGARLWGKWLYDLSYLGWWKRFKPQPEEASEPEPEESPKSRVRFTDSFEI